MTSNSGPDGDVPTTSDGDVTLATLLALLDEEPALASTLSDIQAEYAPTKDRVAIATSTDTVYIGDGSAWVEAQGAVTLLASRAWRRLAVVTSATTLNDRGVIQPVDTSGGTVTVTLDSDMVVDGAEVVVKDEGGNAGTNAITVDTEGSETIDGASSQSIGSNYGVLRLYSDGTNWFTR